MFYNVLNVALQLGKGLGFVPNPVSFMEEVEKLLMKYLESLFINIYKIMQYLTIVLTLLTTSTAFYAVLYNLIMPTKLHEKPIYFQYPQRDILSRPTSTAFQSSPLSDPFPSSFSSSAVTVRSNGSIIWMLLLAI